MLRTFPFLILALICSVIGDPELSPEAGVTRFRDLSFFNNLVNFVDETAPENGRQTPQKRTASFEEEDGNDNEGDDDSNGKKSGPSEEDSEKDEAQSPKTIMSKKGVKVEINKQKKVSYDTEFTLSLKWRPIRTAKSIKKMLLFFPKKIERTAFGKWEHMRGGSMKNNEDSKDSNKGSEEKSTNNIKAKEPRPFYEPFDDNELVYCDDGGSDSCYGYPADVFEDDYWSEFDDDDDDEDWECYEDCDDDEDWDDGESGNIEAEGDDDAEDEGEYGGSDGECNTNGSTEDWSDNESPGEAGIDPNYPFFVRLSSYTADPKSSFNITSKSSKEKAKKNAKQTGSKGTKEAASKGAKDSGLKASKDSGIKASKDSATKGTKNSASKGSKDSIVKTKESAPKKTKETSVKSKDPVGDSQISQRIGDSSSNTPEQDPQFYPQGRKRTRHKPGYVLVDSEILVNTVCPHMLNDFKSSPQQWGKKKEVFVKLYNTTQSQSQGGSRFFPGDKVSSMGSFVRRSIATLLVGLLSSIIPF